MTLRDHLRRQGRPLALTVCVGLVALGAGCSDGLTPEQRQQALAESLDREDWDRSLSLVERSSLRRADKNLIAAAVHHRRGHHELRHQNWNKARLAFIEARRLSGNPEFWWDEALAYRGFGNRKTERETYQKYLGLLPDGEHAEDARRRLRRIGKQRIVRPRHDEDAQREAAAKAAKQRERARKGKREDDRPPPPKAPPGIRKPTLPAPPAPDPNPPAL